MIRAAVIFTNYGPYHIARGRALADQPEIDPIFIELAREEKLYPWIADKDAISNELITLSDQAYESCEPGEISRKLIQLLRNLQPEAVVIAGYSELPMRAAARWARANGKHVVMMSDSTKWDYKRYWWREQLKRSWISRNVEAGFVAGTASRAYLMDLGLPGERIWERYDVVDNHYFASRAGNIRTSARAEREKARLPDNYFLYVGRFSPEKNLKRLLQAYVLYKDSSNAPWGLVLVGDGPQREELQSIARSEGLDEIVWPGFKYVQELPLYYALAGCLILPSVREPWGLVVNEAMASGLPVLVSNVCGCSLDLVRDGSNGFTFDPYNPSQLAELMTEVSSLPSARLDELGQASAEIIAQLTPEHWAQNLSQAITSVTGPQDRGKTELVSAAS